MSDLKEKFPDLFTTNEHNVYPYMLRSDGYAYDWCKKDKNPDVVLIEGLEKYCLSKQKAKEMLTYLEKQIPNSVYDREDAENYLRELRTAFRAVRKDLGLEKDDE